MLMGTGPLPGMVARLASHTNWLDVAHAKSPTVSATKCHCSRSPAAVALPGPLLGRRRRWAQRGVGVQHVGQALPRRGGEHLVGVLEHARGAHDPAGGHVDASRRSGRSCCRTPTGPRYGSVSQPAQVVEHRHPRIPLGHLVQRVGPARPCARRARCRTPGHLEAPLGLQRRRAVRRDGVRQRDARRRRAPARTPPAAPAAPAPPRRKRLRRRVQVHVLPVDRQLGDVHAAGDLRHRLQLRDVGRGRCSGPAAAGSRVMAESLLLWMTAVSLPVTIARGRVQARVDRVVHPQLPVASGPACPWSHACPRRAPAGSCPSWECRAGPAAPGTQGARRTSTPSSSPP